MFASPVGRSPVFCLVFAILMLGLVTQPARAEIGSFILVDAKSGAVIEQKNATRKWYPASLTKMMTAYVTFKAIKEGRIALDSAVVQSKNSIAEPPSKMGFKVGTRFTVDTALKIIIIKSANDVAVALGEAVAGSESGFIAMMNAEAKRLGMSNTRFTNPHGLPDNRQVTTARDMAILAMALRRDFPEAREFYKHPGIRFGKKTLRSANREFLLRVPGANGMKTGYICNSGYNVAASVTRGRRTLIAIVLGAGSGLERTAFARQQFDQGFKKRSKGKKVTSLTGSSGNPPADGYCRRNKSPGAKGYIAQFDIENEPSGGLLSFGKSKKKKPKEASLTGFKMANGKTNWAKILDRTIGPRKVAYRPLKVGLGKPKAGSSVSGSASASVSIPAEDIPLPTANPVRRAQNEIRTKLQKTQAAAAVGAADPAERTADPVDTTVQAGAIEPAPVRPGSVVDTNAATHGSIFRKGLDFSVPIPAPSPNK
ncbi:MAG: D-alanyl-D-alanine carboxypeptidase family protein [Roseibium sp.]